MPRGNPNWKPGGSDYRPAGGDGWGGHARGGPDWSRRSFSEDWQPEPGAVEEGKKSKAAMRAALNQRRHLYAEQLDDLALNSENPAVKLNAVKAIIEILDGKPTQPLAGENGEKVTSVTYRWASDDELQQATE